MKVRPKRFSMYSSGFVDMEPKMDVVCTPRQQWNAVVSPYDGTMVILTRQNVTMYVSKEDFEAKWITVEEKKIKTYRDN